MTASIETPLIGDVQPLVTNDDDTALKGVKVGVVTFPGSLDDRDAVRAVRLAGGSAVQLWHGDHDLQEVDAVIIPGGFGTGKTVLEKRRAKKDKQQQRAQERAEAAERRRQRWSARLAGLRRWSAER